MKKKIVIVPKRITKNKFTYSNDVSNDCVYFILFGLLLVRMKDYYSQTVVL